MVHREGGQSTLGGERAGEGGGVRARSPPPSQSERGQPPSSLLLAPIGIGRMAGTGNVTMVLHQLHQIQIRHWNLRQLPLAHGTGT